MGKVLIVLISTLAILVTPQVVLAEDSMTTTNETQKLKVSRPVDAMKSERQDLLQQKQALMADFRTKLAGIKDTKKKMIVERIDGRIASANAALTNKMTRALEKMSGFLERAKTRSTTFKSEGKDTTALDAAITAAENAITAAKAAIDEQKAKTYTAQISDETTLRNTIGTTVSLFRTDISAVHKLVVSAKQALSVVIREMAKLGGVDKTATNSATINTQ